MSGVLFSSLGSGHGGFDHHESNRSNEMKEKMGTIKGRKQATVKPISAHDQKTLDTAIAMANEFTARSMSAPAPTTPASPNKKKFSFKFPSVHDHDKHNERRNFSEEALSTCDLQSKVTQEAHAAYEGLVERPPNEVSQLMVTNPLRILRSGQPVISSRTRSSSVASTLPPKFGTAGRGSVPENLNVRQEFSHATLPRPAAPSHAPPPKPAPAREDNPIPLPPRDRSKALLSAKPRHTRKHPLIIPHTSLQRTLDKVNTVSPPPPSPTNADPFQLPPKPDPIYANNMVHKDAEAIHFEEQIASNLNALDEIPSDQDVVDGDEGFSSLKVEDEKIHSHHVSCEDLLKFANSKPPSRTRGNDSDEVRIMSKVLGKDVTLEKCLQALDQSDWDVMKAIKILKLQNVVVSEDLSNLCDALEHSMWDITKAAQWILQQDGEVTQV